MTAETGFMTGKILTSDKSPRPVFIMDHIRSVMRLSTGLLSPDRLYMNFLKKSGMSTENKQPIQIKPAIYVWRALSASGQLSAVRFFFTRIAAQEHTIKAA